ncbi:MAG: isoprenyl transferase [Alloprevotella sp.]|nr:isoprenyl transferase [Bacteroidales bacterium]MDY3943950.1 isoprenyl transferase [Alloprevotella sp.]
MSTPQHIAIIMDGNGRWAKERGMERSSGHEAGVETVHRITEAASQMGVRYLTLYAFSTENWNRPESEVAALMSLIISSMEEELFMRNNVRLRLIGDIDRLPEAVRKSILGTVERTAGNTGLTVIIALSYSSKWELTEAMRAIAKRVQAGELLPETISEATIGEALNTAEYPDPELLIRTGGEVRLSNFLLWQTAYSELYFCDTYWPDFQSSDLQAAIDYYNRKERRFGLTSEQVTTTAQ